MLEPIVEKKKVLDIINYILLIVQAAVSILFSLVIIKMNVLPYKYMIIITVILVVLMVFNLLLLKWKPGKIIGCILSVIIITVLCFGGYYAYRTSHMLDGITSVDIEKYNVNIYVKADDKAQTVNDAAGYTFGILSELDRENTDETVAKVNETLKVSISTKEYASVTDLMNALMNGDVGAIILNEGYISVLEGLEQYKDISSNIKAIYINEIDKKVEEPKEKPQEDVVITKKSFIVYISGIDTKGPVSTRSRSDVNILMVVNPVDKKILLVNTPRDFYVPLSISKGVKDKLTHAGTYGINVSMDTLEMLYGVDINYYVRLNFTGFINIIDALGGVDIYSDYGFQSSFTDHYYNEGKNTLNGQLALFFSRERYAFSAGDRQRGKNQMAVIKAVIDKLTSKAILNNYTDLLNSIGNSMQTNMSMDEIGDLVKMQLNDMSSWEVSTCSVDGTGLSSYTYSMPNFKAYVMVPNEATVSAAKEKIIGIMGN